MFRRVYRGIKEGEVCLKRTNREVYKLYNSPKVRDQIKSQRIRWLGYVERLPETRAAKKMARVWEKKEDCKQGRMKNNCQ